MGACGFVTGPATSDLIESQLSAVMGYGNTAFGMTTDALNELKDIFSSTFSPDPVGVGVNGSNFSAVVQVPAFTKPTAPADLTLTFNAPAQPPAPPDMTDAPTLNIGMIPVFSETAPTYALPSRPNALTATPPADPAAIVVPAYPDTPTLLYPNAPDPRNIVLPTLSPPDLASIEAWLATLRSERPEAPNVFLNDNFLSTLDSQYAITQTRLADYLSASPVVSTTRSTLATQLAGSSIGVSASVAQMLRDRAFAAEDTQAFQAEQAALADWAARGFTLPGGALDAKLTAIRQEARDKKAGLNRDLWLEEAKLEIEALRFAVQQGVAYEGMYRDSWLKLYDLCRNIAQQVFDVQVKAIEARIEVYKAKLAGWQTEADLVKVQLQAELSKLEVYKGQLEAAKLIGQLNQIDVDIYRAALEAVKVRVDIYRTEVDAANAKLTGEVERIKAYGEMVRAYTARVGAYEAEWKAYGSAVQGELGKTEIYKALVQAFGARVDAYGKQVDAEKVAGSFKIDVMKLSLEAWQARVDKFKAELQAETARINSETQIFDSNVKRYGVAVQAEDSYIDSEVKKANLDLSAFKINADIALKKVDQELQKLLETTKITVAALEGIARTGGQVTAGAFSALNMSASMSNGTSFSNSTGCSESYTFKGTA